MQALRCKVDRFIPVNQRVVVAVTRIDNDPRAFIFRRLKRAVVTYHNLSHLPAVTRNQVQSVFNTIE